VVVGSGLFEQEEIHACCHAGELSTNKVVCSKDRGGFFPLTAHAHSPTHWIRFEKCANTHLEKYANTHLIKKCVCTLLKANPIGGRVRAYALKGKINFTYI